MHNSVGSEGVVGYAVISHLRFPPEDLAHDTTRAVAIVGQRSRPLIGFSE